MKKSIHDQEGSLKARLEATEARRKAEAAEKKAAIEKEKAQEKEREEYFKKQREERKAAKIKELDEKAKHE